MRMHSHSMVIEEARDEWELLIRCVMSERIGLSNTVKEPCLSLDVGLIASLLVDAPSEPPREVAFQLSRGLFSLSSMIESRIETLIGNIAANGCDSESFS